MSTIQDMPTISEYLRGKQGVREKEGTSVVFDRLSFPMSCYLSLHRMPFVRPLHPDETIPQATTVITVCSSKGNVLFYRGEGWKEQL